MDGDILLGILVVAASLGCLTCLVLWSRRRINRIARGRFGSARTLERELGRGG